MFAQSHAASKWRRWLLSLDQSYTRAWASYTMDLPPVRSPPCIRGRTSQWRFGAVNPGISEELAPMAHSDQSRQPTEQTGWRGVRPLLESKQHCPAKSMDPRKLVLDTESRLRSSLFASLLTEFSSFVCFSRWPR